MFQKPNVTFEAAKCERLWALAALVMLATLAGPARVSGQQLALASNVKAPLDTVRKAPVKEVDDAFQLDLRHENQRYTLCPSDVIEVTFPFAPSFNQALTIQPDGFATLAGIGDLRLEGLTTKQASQVIESGYARIIDEPMVTVALKDFSKPYFIVTGEVNRPGKYDLRGFTSVTEALALAGGFNDAAKRSVVLLFRRAGNEWYEVKPLNLKRLFQGRDVSEDVEIRSGDMLVVSSNAFSRIKRFIR